MGKFNKVAKVVSDSVNMAGGDAFSRDYKKEVASVILSSMLNGNSFYEKEADRIARIKTLVVTGTDTYGEFLAKAMVYARTEANLRSASHLMANILVENVKGSTYLRPALVKTMVRPDDMIEMLALWKTNHEDVMLPNVLRRAMKDSLETKWNGYHFKKYANEASTYKLKDVVKLARPSSVGKADKDVFKKVIEGTLPAINTAQTVNAGSTASTRAANYSLMLDEGTLGYMAALKNLKNMLEAGLFIADIDNLCKLLENKEAVAKSKVLPFRFVDALDALEKISMDQFLLEKVKASLEKGFVASAVNVNLVHGDEKIALLLDESWSMDGAPFKIGKSLMACIISNVSSANAVGYLWANRCTKVDITTPFGFIKNTSCHGGGTDVLAPLKELTSTNTFVDKIIILTDLQLYGYGINKTSFTQALNAYRKINPKVKVVFWNLQGYSGGTPIKLQGGVMEVSGFSDKLLEVVAGMFDNGDVNYLVKEIEKINLG